MGDFMPLTDLNFEKMWRERYNITGVIGQVKNHLSEIDVVDIGDGRQVVVVRSGTGAVILHIKIPDIKKYNVKDGRLEDNTTVRFTLNENQFDRLMAICEQLVSDCPELDDILLCRDDPTNAECGWCAPFRAVA